MAIGADFLKAIAHPLRLQVIEFLKNGVAEQMEDSQEKTRVRQNIKCLTPHVEEGFGCP